MKKHLTLAFVLCSIFAFKTHSKQSSKQLGLDLEGKIILATTVGCDDISDDFDKKVVIIVDNKRIKLKNEDLKEWFKTTKFLKHKDAKIITSPDTKVLITSDSYGSVNHNLVLNTNNGKVSLLTLKTVK